MLSFFMAVATQPRPPFSGFHATCPDHVGEVPTRSKSVAIDPRSPLFGSTATCPGLVSDCVGIRTGSRHRCFGDESQLFLKSIKTTHYILSPTVTAVTPLESILMKTSRRVPKIPILELTPRHAPLLYPFSFQPLTNCPFCKPTPFLFNHLQIAHFASPFF